MLEQNQEIKSSSAGSTFAFPEICHTVLNPRSFSFVAANAPWPAVNSFELQRQRLAIASLRVASSMLLRQLRMADGPGLSDPVTHLIQSFLSTLKSALLLAACLLGQLGLGLLRLLRHGIPQGLHLWASTNLLHNVGDLLTDGRLKNPVGCEEIITPCVMDRCAFVKVNTSSFDCGPITADILRALTISLPTDLSRLIFLATLRDNNSGHYYHPEVARRFSDSLADQAMLACHQQIYRRVVALPLEDLTDELDRYIATVPAPRERMIESWKKLKAYRATIPIDADAVSSDIFYMKVEVAVAILESRLPSLS